MKTNEPNQPVEEKKFQGREETVVIGVKLNDHDKKVTEETSGNKEVLKSTAALATATAAIATASGTILGVVSDGVDAADVIATPGEPLAYNDEMEITPQEDIAPEDVIVDVKEPITKESEEAPANQEKTDETQEPAVEPTEVLTDEQEVVTGEDVNTEVDNVPPVDEVPQEEPETEVVVEEEDVVEPGEPLNNEEIAQVQEDAENETSEIMDTDLAEAIVSPGLQVDDSTIQEEVIEPVQIQPFNVNPTPLEIELTGLGDDIDSQTALFTVHEQTIFDDGESQNAAVSITNNATGEDFMLVDSDGDGIYESVYDIDGEFVSNAGGNIKVDDIREMIASNEDFVADSAWDVLHPHYDIAATDELIYSDDSTDQPDVVDVDDSMMG